MEFEDTELAIVRDKWNQLVRETDVDYPPSEDASSGELVAVGYSRLDVIRLRPFVESVEWSSEIKGRSPIDDALELFWSQYFPQITRSQRRMGRPRWRTSRLPAEQLSEEQERLMLECLEYLERRHRVPYQPDVSDGRWEEELKTYLHIAAARAFRLKRSEGLSEEVQDCLFKVERTLKRLGGVQGVSLGYESPAFDTSLVAVSALAFVELSRVSRVDREYVEALHYLAEAMICYELAVNHNAIPMGERYDAEDLEAIGPVESLLRPVLENHLTGLQVSLEESKSVFELVRASASSTDGWAQVARDCKELAISWNVSGVEEETTDEQGRSLTWSEYWHGAHAWASAQLSQSEYVKLRAKDEEKAAKRRLKTYFFGNSWETVPPRAQEALISADNTWSSTQRVRRESILNELLRATEEMCYEFIWQPLARSKSAYPEFQGYEDEVAERRLGSYPSVRNYVDVCEDSFFLDFCTSRGLGQADEKFMVESLPIALRQLADRRNPAEHESSSTIPSEVITDCFRTFLGIGQQGVLPEFARIGRKLRGRR